MVNDCERDDDDNHDDECFMAIHHSFSSFFSPRKLSPYVGSTCLAGPGARKNARQNPRMIAKKAPLKPRWPNAELKVPPKCAVFAF
jgi:hypothetical protein